MRSPPVRDRQNRGDIPTRICNDVISLADMPRQQNLHGDPEGRYNFVKSAVTSACYDELGRRYEHGD